MTPTHVLARIGALAASLSVAAVIPFTGGCGDKDLDDTEVADLDGDGDGFTADEDCDDADPDTHPGADERCDGADNDCDGDVDEDPVDGTTWYLDADADGYGTPDTSTQTCGAQPEGMVADATDCDDTAPDVNPSVLEVCGGGDEDCDGLVDDADDTLDPSGATRWYADTDGDTFGDPQTHVLACAAPTDYVPDATDCDDTDPTVNPAAAEVCNGWDDDCDALVDDTDDSLDTTGATTWYADTDGDGFGSTAFTRVACAQPELYVADATDCDDDDPAVNPGATEVCNGDDDDCDALVDDDDTSLDLATATDWHADTDGDGYGAPSVATTACVAPADCVTDATDCDDTTAAVSPAATEVCNDGVDDDCDGDADDHDPDLDLASAGTWYTDADGDTYGDPAHSSQACVQPVGTVGDATDCDDTTAAVSPAATEVCNDGVDDDCDGDADDDDASLDTTTTGSWFADTDGDGFGNSDDALSACAQPVGYVGDATDCDDTTAAVSPGAAEVCGGVDEDCDGDIDDDDASLDLSTANTWYDDADGDGWGDPSVSAVACLAPTGFLADGTDCAPTDGAVNPGATEVCNGLDEDCDGDIDDDDASLDLSTARTFYDDDDGDTFGDPASAVIACFMPMGTVTDNQDCDDTLDSVNPAATEVCNGWDDDCDGDVDDDDPDLDPSTRTTWYFDGDDDGYGDSGMYEEACVAPAGHVASWTDCDPSDGAVFPGAPEVCNGIDDDCDGDTDDDDTDLNLATAPTWYADADLDGYGDGLSPVAACVQPPGTVADGTDCDDGDVDVYPGQGCSQGVSCDALLGAGLDTDGEYAIDPDEAGSVQVWCDQEHDGGGWTLLLSADGDSTLFGNNAPAWWAPGTDNYAPAGLVNADYHSPAYGRLETQEIRLCYQDADHCHVFDHGYGITLQEFFTTGTTYTEYSYRSYGYSDVGADAMRTSFYTDLGQSTWSQQCYWMGINDTLSISAIGLLGDGNGGCSHLSGSHRYHDDLALGVGLQSCRDANGCSTGGSENLAGQTRGVGGVDDSGTFGPWHVFGR